MKSNTSKVVVGRVIQIIALYVYLYLFNIIVFVFLQARLQDAHNERTADAGNDDEVQAFFASILIEIKHDIK